MSSKRTDSGEILLIAGAIAVFEIRRVLKVWVIGSFLGICILVVLVVMLLLVPKRQKTSNKLTNWSKLSGVEFEREIGRWLKDQGFKQVEFTEYFDKGIDLLAARPGIILGVQVKRSARLIGVGAIRAAVAAKNSYGCTQVMVVTDSDYTPRAIELANDNQCLLIDGKMLRSNQKLFFDGVN